MVAAAKHFSRLQIALSRASSSEDRKYFSPKNLSTFAGSEESAEQFGVSMRRCRLRCRYINLEDGREADGIYTRGSWRFFRRFSPLPSHRPSPNLQLIIFIETETEFVEAAPGRQLRAAAHSALHDPSFAIFLRGVRSGSQPFWELRSSDLYVNAESGKLSSKSESPALRSVT